MAIFYKTYKVKDLLDIDPGRRERSKDIKIKLSNTFDILKSDSLIDRFIGLFKRNKSKLYFKVFKYHALSDSGETYTVLIKVSPNFDKSKFLENKIEIFCQCEDFKYRVAYWLAQRDNLYLIDSTIKWLDIAIKTKPTRVVPSNLCKHCYAALMDFEKNLNKLII